MTCASGPKIFNTGLTFSYDISNLKKSWSGKPTINYITNPTEEMARGEFGQYRDLAPAFNANGLVPYSLSMDMKANKPGSVLVYMQNGSSTKYGFVSTNVNVTTEYQRFYFNNITPAISTATDTAATLATYTGYGSGINPTVKNIQLELGPFATPFVDGTRLSTQSILDLAKINTITANSLTYASDGTFSFDGSNNYISATGPGFANLSEYTISFWAKRDAENRMPIASLSGTGFYWYGDNSWRYTHGGVGGEHYYSKPTSIPLGTWGHYCVTYNGSTISIYRQGVLQSTAASSGTANWSTGMMIGYWNGGAGYQWQGKINQVSIHNRALSAAEIAHHFESHRSRYGI